MKVELTRRWFLTGLATTAAVAAMPVVPAPVRTMVLEGERAGVTFMDRELNAVLARMDGVWRGSSDGLIAGTFDFTDRAVITHTGVITNVILRCGALFDGAPIDLGPPWNGPQAVCSGWDIRLHDVTFRVG